MTMPRIALVVPGRLDQRTGGYIYDRRMAEELRRRGWQVDVVELDDGFPCPTPTALDDASRAIALIPAGTLTIVDSLAFGAMPDVVERESRRLPMVALVHLPLSAGVCGPCGTVASIAEAERRAFVCAVLTIVTGRAALSLLSPYDLPPDRIAVVEPGTDRAPLARGSRPGATPAPVELLCAATVNPLKGHEVLLEALAAMPTLEWRLTCAGSLTRDTGASDRVRAAIERLGLATRVSLVGDQGGEALAECFDRTDVFVLATRQETYGMAVAEALAHGLPVVATRTGAIAELVGDAAGIVVPVDDRAALTSALTRVIGDGNLRARLAAGARQVRSRLATWEEAAARMAVTLEPLAHG